MIFAYIPDVGDGLAVGIRTVSRLNLQIDCGSQQSPESAFRKGLQRINPAVFILSHFHLDHYNGLFQWESHGSWRYPRIEEVYFPRIPEFADRETLVLALFAMNHRLMGDTTGSMEADFLSVLSRINRIPFTFHFLSMSDTITTKGSNFKVLWPPKVIHQTKTLKVIREAIEDFNTACQEDEPLQRIYETIKQKGEIQPYVSGDQAYSESAEHSDQARNQDSLIFPYREGNLPEVVRRANKSLRKAANHLSLAFHEDNRLLFMGDLEGYEIRQVVRELQKKARQHFLIVITPHHGTHWHNEMHKLHTLFAVSSVGNILFKSARSDYKTIAETCLLTHFNGDIEVPIGVSSRFSPGWLRGWYFRI